MRWIYLFTILSGTAVCLTVPMFLAGALVSAAFTSSGIGLMDLLCMLLILPVPITMLFYRICHACVSAWEEGEIPPPPPILAQTLVVASVCFFSLRISLGDFGPDSGLSHRRHAPEEWIAPGILCLSVICLIPHLVSTAHSCWHYFHSRRPTSCPRASPDGEKPD